MGFRNLPASYLAQAQANEKEYLIWTRETSFDHFKSESRDLQ